MIKLLSRLLSSVSEPRKVEFPSLLKSIVSCGFFLHEDQFGQTEALVIIFGECIQEVYMFKFLYAAMFSMSLSW